MTHFGKVVQAAESDLVLTSMSVRRLEPFAYCPVIQLDDSLRTKRFAVSSGGGATSMAPGNTIV